MFLLRPFLPFPIWKNPAQWVLCTTESKAYMNKDNLAATNDLIVRDFELEPQEKILTEEELLGLLSDILAEMIERRLEFLLSLMYRLDIDEKKVHFALSPFCEEPANIALARLILERQKQRAFTKQYYKQEDLGDLEGLEL